MTNVAETDRCGGAALASVEEYANVPQLADETEQQNGSVYGPLPDSLPIGTGPVGGDASENLPEIAEPTGGEVAASLLGSFASGAMEQLVPAPRGTDVATPAVAAAEIPQLSGREQGGTKLGPSLRCAVDAAAWNGISGWIWNPRVPAERVTLELLDGETVLAAVVADRSRPDLAKAGMGDGRYGFWIPLSETLLPHARHVLHLRTAGAKQELPSFPLVLHARPDRFRFYCHGLLARQH